jgi:hypothetical protein
MPLSVMNFVFARTLLERDLVETNTDSASGAPKKPGVAGSVDAAQGSAPGLTQAEIDRFALLAAFVPGTAGLIVPFIAENNLTKQEGDDNQEKPPNGTGPKAIPAAVGTPLSSADVVKRLDAGERKIDSLAAGLDDLKKSLDDVKAALAPKPSSSSVTTKTP